MSTTKKWTDIRLFTDGGSRGNPGEAAVGYVIYDKDGEVLYRYAEPIGIRTNNYAEYMAMIEGLEKALTLGDRVFLSMDSELIVKQIKREYKVKNADLKPLYDEAIRLISKFEHFEIRHVRRENNKEADRLVNLALDRNQRFEEIGFEFRQEKPIEIEKMPAEDDKMKRLRERIRSDQRVMVAFSGGVDSSLLAKICQEELGANCHAVTIQASNISIKEREQAERFVRQTGIDHRWIDVDIYSIEDLVKNEKDRCYTCKKFLFSRIVEEAQKIGIQTIYDGSTADDLSDYRPGMKALKELGIVSPMMEANFTKDDIRRYSKALALETHDKEAMACLITRIPYRQEITERKLRMIEEAEEVVRSLGYHQVRVRMYEDWAKIEIAPEEIGVFVQSGDYRIVDVRLRTIGFAQVSLDLSGYRSGSMNG